MKRIPWRGALYLLVLGYLFLDFKVFHGPVRDAMRSRRDAAYAEAEKQGWAALVNLEPITRSQLELAVERHLYQRGRTAAEIPEKNLAMIRRAVLQGLIDETIVRQYADGEKFEAPASERAAFVERWSSAFPEAGEREARFAAQGLDEAAATLELGRIWNRTRWLETRISRAVVVTEEEAREWFAANGGGSLESSEEAPGFIEPAKVKLRYRIFADEAEARAFFEKLSPGNPQAAEDGAWIARDRLDPALRGFADAEPGWKAPVRTERGWVLMEVLESQPARPLEFEEIRAEIIAHLEAERSAETVRELLVKYRTVANLQIFAENL